HSFLPHHTFIHQRVTVAIREYSMFPLAEQKCPSRESVMDDYKLIELFCPTAFGLFALAIAVDQTTFRFCEIAKWLSLSALGCCFISACLTRKMLARVCPTRKNEGEATPVRCESYCHYYTIVMRVIGGMTFVCLAAGFGAFLV
ncbi:hypothetical protein FRC02_002862, partial [Tulasnella sp. 418]